MTTNLPPEAGGAPPSAPRFFKQGSKQAPSGPIQPSLHSLEQMKVLCPRSLKALVSQFRCKEWWYTGAYDPVTGVYISWYFVRVNLADKLTMTVFDPELADKDLPHLDQFCRLDPRQPGDGLCLAGKAQGLETSYRLAATDQWKFTLTSGTLVADIDIAQTIPPFTKFDNEMQDRYGIIHYFHSRANGEVHVPGGARYTLSNALVYQDHAYGRVPNRTDWHWIAVQSGRIALTALVNYGAYAQRFAQVWLEPECGNPRSREWIRLEQSVSFERQDPGDVKGPWRISSTDLDLTVLPKQMQRDRARIPPGLGLFVNLEHIELFVMAEGRVRIDGTWVNTQPMYGVMEQHHGHW